MSLASGSIDLKSLKVAGEANKYITAINEDGVKVHAANNINLNYTQITSEGMEVFKTNGATSNPSAISVAKFGQTSIIGRQDQSHIKIINNGLSILNSGITLFDLLLDENQQAKLQHEYDFGEIILLPGSEYYLKKYRVVTIDNNTFSTDMEFEELQSAIDTFIIDGFISNYNLDGTRTSFNVQFDVATTATKTIGQEYVLKSGHEEETPTEQNTVLITIYGRHVANSNSITFYTNSNNELPSSVDLLLLKDLKCYKMTGLPVLTLGLKDRSHVKIDYHSLKLIDKEGEPYLHISDLRDEEGYVTNNFIGDGSTTEFYISGSAQNTIVTVNDIEQTQGTDYTYIELSERYIISFSTAPSLNASILVRYLPYDGSLSKSYTFGKRNTENSEWSILGNYSFAEGYNIIASGMYSHAEGEETTAYGSHSHAEGYQTGAWGKFSHAEGISTSANTYCHAEGYGSNASGNCTHAEGYQTVASGDFGAHAEGYDSEASNHFAHAEGASTIASGAGSHAEGYNTEASGPYSHAQNSNTIASSESQTAIGKGNIEDNNDSYSFIIGNGYYDNNDDLVRSNALTVDWNGSINSYINCDTDSTYNTDASGTTEAHYLTQFAVVNSNNNKTAYIDVHKWSYGESLAVFGMQRIFNGANNTSETVQNQFGLGIKSDKSLYVWIPDNAKKAWNQALNADYITEQGTSGIWRYRKWASGTAECWALTNSTNYSITSVYGNGYYANLPTVSFPSGLFNAAPSLQATRANAGSAQGLIFISCHSVTASGFGAFISSLSSGTFACQFAYHAIGRYQ